MRKQCEQCGRDFTAERTTARFCSDHCRVTAHRYKDCTVTLPAAQIRELVHQIGRAKQQKKFAREAVGSLLAIQSIIETYLPKKNTLWTCAKCGRLFNGVLPGENNCRCGDKAQWYIAPKLPTF